MNSSEITTVFFKEMTEVLRDIRTLFAMIVIPVVFYPVYFAGPQKMLETTETRVRVNSPRVAVSGDWQILRSCLEGRSDLVAFDLGDLEPESAIRANKADLVLVVPPDFSQKVNSDIKLRIGSPPTVPPEEAADDAPGTAPQDATEGTLPTLGGTANGAAQDKRNELPVLQLRYDGRQTSGVLALGRVENILNNFRDQLLKERLKLLESDETLLNDPAFSYVKSKTGADRTDAMLATVLPYIQIFMILIAILYPSLDLITGERERGTLQLLLVAPTSRPGIMMGKLLVVVTIGFLAVLMGLTSLYTCLCLGWITLPGSQGISSSMPAVGFLFALVISVPLVVTLSALSMLVAACARTFQQGQALFLPFMVATLIPVLVASVPDTELASFISVVPIANLSLCLKEACEGKFQWAWIVVSVTSSCVFAAYTMQIAARLLEREDLLFGIEKSPARRQQEGNFFPELAGLGAVVFFLMFYVGQLLQAWDIVFGMILTQLIVVLLPAVSLLRLMKFPIVSTLRLSRCDWRLFVGAALLAPVTVFLASLWLQIQNGFMPGPEGFSKIIMDKLVPKDRPVWEIVLALAIFPAICEEILFRGTILGLLRRKVKEPYCILIVGLMFGAFHLSIYRIIPTAMAGMALTWVALKTRSIFPGMLLHALHNAILILATIYAWQLTTDQWMVGAALSLGLAAVFCGWALRKGSIISEST